MAPLCADPRQVVIALNPARRQALLRLVDEIVEYMISQIETSADDLGSLAPADIDDSDEYATSRHTKVSSKDDDGGDAWDAWQEELPIPGRNIARLYENFAEGKDNATTPSAEDALKRHVQLGEILEAWTPPH